MQKVILCVCVFVKMFCYSAFGEEPDTLIMLNEATVSARKLGDFGAGHHSTTIDSTTISRFSASDLGSLLRWNSGVPIRSFGPGSLATTNLRGGTAGQTAVLWNGFSLHSPMNGQTDLSSLPAFFADEIQLQQGGSSAIWGSGAMGGAIFLNNRRNATQGLSGQVGLNAGSSDDFSQSVRLEYGSRYIGSTLRFFNRDAQNNYRFSNDLISGAPIEKQQNAGFGLTGLLHEIWFRLGPDHQIDLRWWWQENQRNIPPSLEFPQFLSEQSDRSLRVSAQYQVNLPEVSFFLRGARFREELSYRDNFGFSSSSNFVVHAGEAEARWVPGPRFTMNSGILFQDNKALATDYAGEKRRTSWAIFTSARWAPVPGKLDFVVSGRQELISGMEIPFTPSLGFSFTFFPNWKVKANTGYSFRLPSMNDMYWNPGGNPDLLPEQGWNSDLRVEFDVRDKAQQSNFVPFQYLSTGVYNRSIRNWIIWLPQGDSWLWMPENRAQVNSFGLESIMSGFWQTATIKAHWTIRYDHTIARNVQETRPNDTSLNKQLIYVPLNRAMLNLALTYKQLGLIYDHEFSGKRFNSSDNTTWLPSFQTGNLAIHWNSAISAYKVGLNLTVENIWNTRFQILSNRPMPLRIIRAGIKIGFAGSR
ncbi:MAG TPA: TonB-dependent receptor [Bacteroidales bacterium]|nr:TonB-dependent receptor [Bacteroidales bacterium]